MPKYQPEATILPDLKGACDQPERRKVDPKWRLRQNEPIRHHTPLQEERRAFVVIICAILSPPLGSRDGIFEMKRNHMGETDVRLLRVPLSHLSCEGHIGCKTVWMKAASQTFQLGDPL